MVVESGKRFLNCFSHVSDISWRWAGIIFSKNIQIGKPWTSKIFANCLIALPMKSSQALSDPEEFWFFDGSTLDVRTYRASFNKAD